MRLGQTKLTRIKVKLKGLGLDSYLNYIIISCPIVKDDSIVLRKIQEYCNTKKGKWKSSGMTARIIEKDVRKILEDNNLIVPGFVRIDVGKVPSHKRITSDENIKYPTKANLRNAFCLFVKYVDPDGYNNDEDTYDFSQASIISGDIKITDKEKLLKIIGKEMWSNRETLKTVLEEDPITISNGWESLCIESYIKTKLVVDWTKKNL